MTNEEIIDWLSLLGTGNATTGYIRCTNDLERIEVIQDLLSHARGDKMTDEDKQICQDALAKLQHGSQQ